MIYLHCGDLWSSNSGVCKVNDVHPVVSFI